MPEGCVQGKKVQFGTQSVLGVCKNCLKFHRSHRPCKLGLPIARQVHEQPASRFMGDIVTAPGCKSPTPPPASNTEELTSPSRNVHPLREMVEMAQAPPSLSPLQPPPLEAR